MRTIDDLPAELLNLILECVHEDQGYASEESHRWVLHSLASASLVARRWRTPAPSLLWHNLIISECVHVDLLLASASLGQHRTRRLVASYAAADATSLGDLIVALDGVESIDIDSSNQDRRRGDTPSAWLWSPKLQGLKSLELDVKFEPTNGSAASMPFPFRLTSLDLTSSGWHSSALFFHIPGSPVVTQAILDSSAATLTSLDINKLYPIRLHAASFTSLTSFSTNFATLDGLNVVDAFVCGLPAPLEYLTCGIKLRMDDSQESQVFWKTLMEKMRKTELCVEILAILRHSENVRAPVRLPLASRWRFGIAQPSGGKQ
ncbi:hypothetical protein RQP46_009730 [Phenoliferia psychrophenolica]